MNKSHTPTFPKLVDYTNANMLKPPLKATLPKHFCLTYPIDGPPSRISTQYPNFSAFGQQHPFTCTTSPRTLPNFTLIYIRNYSSFINCLVDISTYSSLAFRELCSLLIKHANSYFFFLYTNHFCSYSPFFGQHRSLFLLSFSCLIEK